MLGRVSPVTRVTLPACRAPYPGGPRRARPSVASPPRAAFPEIQTGRRPRLHFRGLLRLHSRYDPPDRSTARGGLRHEASTRPVAQASRSSATRSTDNSLGGTFLHWRRAPSGRTEFSGLDRIGMDVMDTEVYRDAIGPVSMVGLQARREP